MQIPFTKLDDQYNDCKLEIDQAIKNILQSNEFVNGPIIKVFETKWAEHCSAEDCAAVSNGTQALVLSLRACGIGHGHQVITTPHTFVSTVEAIKSVGADPVFIDIDEYYHMDIEKIEEKINHKTKAILFVDLYGQTPNISKLKSISQKHNLTLIEDAAHSTGAEYKNKRVGGLVDLTCFSFNPIKNLGAIGDAGAVTGKQHLIDNVKILRDHGRIDYNNYIEIGYNARMDCLQASVLLEKMKFYLDWNHQKRLKANTYNNELKCITPNTKPDCLHSFYAYVIQVPHRDKFVNYMAEQGIITKVQYPTSMNTHKPYAPYQPCETSEWTCQQVVSLPCYYSMSELEQSYVIKHTNSWINTHS